MTAAGAPRPAGAAPPPAQPPPAQPPPAQPPPGPSGAPPAGPQAAGAGAGPAAAGAEPRRRLHPLSPLLHGAKSIAVIVAALSWQTLSQVGLGRFALVVAVLAVAVVVVSAISWLNTGYHVVGRELRIAEGLLWRRNRAIPLERLQAVELRRPLLAQLTGLAELRLEVVGGGRTEAPLAYLSVREAARLRERLLALAARAGGTPGAAPAAAGPAPPPGAVAPEQPLLRVANGDLVVSQLLTPQALFLPVGVVFVIVQFVLEGSWTFVGIASTVTAMAGVVLQPARRVLQDWDFRLARDHDGRLAVRYGLLETRSQTVPLHRVQSVTVTWPLLWRIRGWLHLRLDIAGFTGPDTRDGRRSDRLLPVGVPAVARALVADVLPGVDLATLVTPPPPRRARWLHPLAWRSFGAGLGADVFAVRSGLLTRQLMVMPYARMQSIRVVQGPLQRRLGLASVYADAAGGRWAVAHDRDLAEAWAMAADLDARARRARRTPPAARPAPPAGHPAAPPGLPPAAPPVAPPPGPPVAPPAGPPVAPPAGPPVAPPAGPPVAPPAGPPVAPPAGPPAAPPVAPSAAVPDDDAYWRRPAGS